MAADTAKYYSRLTESTQNFSDMMNHFGVVTVMDADIFELPADNKDFKFEDCTPEGIYADIKSAAIGTPTIKGFTKLAHLDTLKIANITIEGPTKTVMGGQFSNPLLKFGKTARIEMQDALGHADAISAFGGVVNEYTDSKYTKVAAMHVTEDFAPARLICGKSFFVNQKTGETVDVIILLYQVVPDSIFNLTQDAEGDATVFDLNGEVLTTKVLIGTDGQGASVKHGVFYSIIPTNTLSE